MGDRPTVVCMGDTAGMEHAPRKRIGQDANEPCFVCLGVVDETGRVIDRDWLRDFLKDADRLRDFINTTGRTT